MTPAEEAADKILSDKAVAIRSGRGADAAREHIEAIIQQAIDAKAAEAQAVVDQLVDELQSLLDNDSRSLVLRTVMCSQIGWRVERASVGWTHFDGPFSTKALADEAREAAEALAQGAAKEKK